MSTRKVGGVEGFLIRAFAASGGALFALLLTACSTAPSYQVPPERMGEAARIRGTAEMGKILGGNWHHFSLTAVDGVRWAPGVLRTSDRHPRPVESGDRELMLQCEGSEDRTHYYAMVPARVTLLPGETYTINGRIGIDKVTFWIERDGSEDKITAELVSQRVVRPPMPTTYVPIIIPK